MDTTDFVTHNQLLADALVFCGDEATRERTKGWYVSQVQRALEELAIDTFFNERTVDLPFNKVKLQMELPSNMFNLRELYMWSGDCCSPQNSVIVHYKRHHNNKPGVGGTGHTARRKENQMRDQFFAPTSTTSSSYDPGVYYANMQDGVLMFSSNCAEYDMVRLVGNGYGGDIGDAPVVPRFLRTAVIDYVAREFFKAKYGKDRTFRLQYLDADAALNKPYDGSWAKARYRIKSMNTWELNSLKEYYSRMNF
jgi:hypothetical protein